MNSPLPAAEIRELLGDSGFLRLYGQNTHLFVSDTPRRVSQDRLACVQHALLAHGFTATVAANSLLLIDLQPARWKALLDMFMLEEPVPFPLDETLHGVYALFRFLQRHPAAFEQQPMDMLRAALKRYAQKDGLTKLAPQLHAKCAQRLRQGQALPYALEKVLGAWITDQS
ncbi:MAG TPA: hypothetical protein PKU80_05460 [Candidatus Limiplasma sp.]|nr:hypothetical protein [Candidatus Limiplasma sp.]HRX09075.1 hypothetical protein [Candidatus Limiplasma sp.]